MQEIHLEGRQRIKSQEMAFTGLFAALIAAGAYMRIDIPVQPFPMHFTLQFFLCFWQAMCWGPDGELPVCAFTWQWDWRGFPYLQQAEGRRI